MFSKKHLQKIGFGALVLIFASGIFTAGLQAQTGKHIKRKPHKVHRIAVAPIVGNPQDAAIISRNDDFANENRTAPAETAVSQNEPETPVITQNDDPKFGDLSSRIKALESKPSNDYDQKQKRLLLNLNILTVAETRADNLRKQLFEMVEMESEIQNKLEQIENDSRPENIDRSVAFAGTLRPEELRDMRAKNLDSAKRQFQSRLTQIQDRKSNLEINITRTDQQVEKLRAKLEKDIDDALVEEPKN